MEEKRVYTCIINKRRCSICEICSLKCPLDAIRVEKRGDRIELLFYPSICNGCGGKPICVEKCPEDAISIFTAMNETEVAPFSLIKGRVSRCVRCGNSFVPEKKASRVSRKAGKGTVEVRVLCPDCRRANVLDSLIASKRENGYDAEVTEVTSR